MQRQHGDAAHAFIAGRVRGLVLAGDTAGVQRWREIASRVDQLQPGSVQ